MKAFFSTDTMAEQKGNRASNTDEECESNQNGTSVDSPFHPNSNKQNKSATPEAPPSSSSENAARQRNSLGKDTSLAGRDTGNDSTTLEQPQKDDGAGSDENRNHDIRSQKQMTNINDSSCHELMASEGSHLKESDTSLAGRDSGNDNTTLKQPQKDDSAGSDKNRDHVTRSQQQMTNIDDSSCHELMASDGTPLKESDSSLDVRGIGNYSLTSEQPQKENGAGADENRDHVTRSREQMPTFSESNYPESTATYPPHFNESDSYSLAVPLCLPSNLKWNQDTRTVEYVNDEEPVPRGSVKICEEGINLIASVGDDLIIVVCVTGPARTGKSFLLSQFHDSLNFELGHSTVSHTTGIWVALSPEKIHVGSETIRVILLDAEGLDAVSTSHDGGNDNWDRKLFSLCTLLSSYMIYNCQGVPHATDLDRLGVIVQFSEAIYYNTQEANMKQAEEDFLKVAPHFLWLVRDARLKPVIADRECSWDTFVEESILTCKEYDVKRNAVRKAIKRVFRSIHAFALPTPVSNEDDFAKLSCRNDNINIKPQFLEGVNEIKSCIFSHPKEKVKRIQGCSLHGGSFHNLLKLYVEQVNKETDKLQVVSVSEVIINSQLSSSMSKAIEKYKSYIQTIKLPEGKKKLTSTHQQAMAEAHSTFDKLTRRIDDNITNASKKKLTENVEKLFDERNALNNEASESHCTQVMKSLEKDLIDQFKSNLQNYGCADITIAKEQLFERYSNKAKGPMTDSVRSKYEPQIKQTVNEYKLICISKAEKNALKIYKDNTNVFGNVPCENAEIQERHEKAQKLCLEVLSRKYDQCHECRQRKRKFCDTLESFLKEQVKTNESASRSYCEEKAKECKRKHFDQSKKFMLTESFTFFQRAKQLVLDEYEKSAKGPAKKDVKKKWEADLESELNVIEISVADAALQTANESYKHRVEKILKGGPYEEEHLNAKKEEVQKEVTTSFAARCKGISEKTLEGNLQVLQHFMESKDDFLLCQNTVQSGKLCNDICDDLFREMGLELSTLTNLARSKTLDESIEFNTKLTDVKATLLKRYSDKAKGPMREKVKQHLDLLIRLKFVETQRLLLDDALEKAIDKFDKLQDEISRNGPYDYEDLIDKLEIAENKVQHELVSGRGKLDDMLIETARKHLQTLAKALRNKCVYRNECDSLRLCEELMIKTTKKHYEYWDKNIFSIDLSNMSALYDTFTKRKEEHISDYKRHAKGPAASKFEQACRTEIDRQIREFQTYLANSNFS